MVFSYLRLGISSRGDITLLPESKFLSHGTCQDVLHIFEEHGLPSDEVLPLKSGGNVGENLDDLFIFESIHVKFKMLHQASRYFSVVVLLEV